MLCPILPDLRTLYNDSRPAIWKRYEERTTEGKVSKRVTQNQTIGVAVQSILARILMSTPTGYEIDKLIKRHIPTFHTPTENRII